MRIGILGRCDNKGLGNMTWEFYKHVKPDKVMIMQSKLTKHLERFPGATIITNRKPNDRETIDFLQDLDLLVTIETPYNRDLFIFAKEMGVKTVMIPMFEFLNPKWIKPDLFICP